MRRALLRQATADSGVFRQHLGVVGAFPAPDVRDGQFLVHGRLCRYGSPLTTPFATLRTGREVRVGRQLACVEAYVGSVVKAVPT